MTKKTETYTHSLGVIEKKAPNSVWNEMNERYLALPSSVFTVRSSVSLNNIRSTCLYACEFSFTTAKYTFNDTIVYICAAAAAAGVVVYMLVFLNVISSLHAHTPHVPFYSYFLFASTLYTQYSLSLSKHQLRENLLSWEANILYQIAT